MIYIIIFLILFIIKLPIPLMGGIIWLEVNVYGKTFLPELLVLIQTLIYLLWRVLWWKLMLETKTDGDKMDII